MDRRTVLLIVLLAAAAVASTGALVAVLSRPAELADAPRVTSGRGEAGDAEAPPSTPRAGHGTRAARTPVETAPPATPTSAPSPESRATPSPASPADIAPAATSPPSPAPPVATPSP